MKRYRLIQTACLAALAVGFASCSQDELSSLTEGVEGAPVTFNASGIAMTQVETRATVDGTWEDGMSVAVKIGSVVKEYAVTPNADDPKRATLAAADGVTPFVWASITEKKDVQAWYPYTAGETTMPALVVQQDQSIEANYLASDLLSVSKQVTYGDNNLQFAHRTAKITLRLEVNEGSTVSMENAQVILHNLSTANGNPGLITCFDASAGDTYIHNALIAPQTFAAGKELLKIVLSDGKVFGYVPDKAVSFQAGCQYPLTITVTDTGMKVTVDEAIPWGDEVNSENSMVISKDGYYVTTDADGRQTYYVSNEAGLKAWAECVKAGFLRTNCTLLNDITLTKNADGSSNWTPIERYFGTVEGNGHTLDNMVVHVAGELGVAAFLGSLSDGGCVRNLTIGSGSSFKASSRVASIVSGCYDAQIVNCHSFATLEGDLLYHFIVPSVIGGIVAFCKPYNACYIMGCSFSGNITATPTEQDPYTFYYGGICGQNNPGSSSSTTHIVGCVNDGTMVLKGMDDTTTNYVGGILGYNESYYTGPINAYVTACAMTGTMSFENVTSTNINSDGAIGHMKLTSATYVYWDSKSIGTEWRQPYRSDDSTYDTLLEVDGANTTWATAVDNMNAAIETWNAANGNLCPVHYVLTGNKPVLMKNQE